MNNEQPKIIYFDKPKHLSLDKIKKNEIQIRGNNQHE